MTDNEYDVHEVERFFQDAFGMGHVEHHEHTHSRFPRAHIFEAKRVVENSGMGPLLNKWRDLDGHDPRGQKPYLSMESALIVLLMHVREGRGLLFTTMANTLANRMNEKDLKLIGVSRPDGNQGLWYSRLWRTVKNLLVLVDPYPYNKKKIPNKDEYKAILANRDPAESARKKARLDYLCHQLVQGSVKTLPTKILSRYKGNKAQDATFFPMSGKAGNPDREDVTLDRRSINIDGGYYMRGGNHGGETAAPDKRWWGNELETVTMIANKPGEPADFPLLTIAVGCHIPGKIGGEGRRIADLLANDGYPAGYWTADRLYLPSSTETEYQEPIIRHGHELVFDYKKDQVGSQGVFEEGQIRQVDGQWYVDVIPEYLVNARLSYIGAVEAAEAERSPEKRAQMVTAAKSQFEEHLVSREKYRLKPKGFRRPDGSQQYMYPDPNSYLGVDESTGEILPPVERKTIVIPIEVGLKYGQRFPYKSQKWRDWYGMRSTVEGSYSFMKDTGREDLGTASQRLARGTAFAYLAATMAVVASNIRRVLEFLKSLTRSDKVTAKNRNNAPTPLNTRGATDPSFGSDQDPPD